MLTLIGGKRVYEVEDHHPVLIPWKQERDRLNTPFHVLTLDHHTDTLGAFTHYNSVHSDSPRSPLCEDLEEAIRLLRHDEHFDFAVRNDIIRSAAIFSHVNFSIDVNPAVRIVHTPPEPGTEEQYYAQILETEFLKKNLEEAPLTEPFVLDIDLDVFKGARSIQPREPELFYELIRRAEAITISRERDWVRLLNLDYGKLQYEYFLEHLLEHIGKALSS